MKNAKAKMSVLALVLGIGSAFATIAKADPTDRKWALDGGVYTDITGQNKGFDYGCEDSPSVCTETYPLGVNPNNNPAGPTHVAPLSTETGIFQ